MLRRAEATRGGGLRAMQREAVPLLLASFDAEGAAARYVARFLQWHCRGAGQPGLPLHADEVLMQA